MWYVCVCCFVVRGSAVSRRYIYVCYCDMFSVVAHCCEVMYFWCFDFRGELGFLNCDNICMYVVNKQFELLEFLSLFVLTCNMMRFISLLLLGLCACGVFVILW